MSRSLTTYNVELLETGLHELAQWGGSAKNASRTLSERGIDIPQSTLQTWKTTHADRLEEITATVLPAIRDEIQSQQAQIARRASEVTLQVIERAAENVDEIPVRDLGGFARNMEITGATAIDKHAAINQLPTEIVQHDSAEDILKRLALKHPSMFVDSTAEEIPQAEVVEEQQPEGRGRQLSRVSSP